MTLRASARQSASDPSRELGSADAMPDLVMRYEADWGCLRRRYGVTGSPQRTARMRDFYAEWSATLDALRFNELSIADQVDWLLMRSHLHGQARRLEREAQRHADVARWLPCHDVLAGLEDARRDMKDVDPRIAADTTARARDEIGALHRSLADERSAERAVLIASDALRIANGVERLRSALQSWFGFYSDFDPLFTWWVERPYRELDTALSQYAALLRDDVAGMKDPDCIVGEPLGREAILEELALALIPYTPEELIAIAARERAHCLAELERASGDMGCGADWRAALARVKGESVEPGRQPALVRDLALEAIAYVEQRGLVSVPPLAKECWRIEMMSPEAQRTNPFFLGGEEIRVSFPAASMEHWQKEMSRRGNNRHFARATVQHELIPGHHLQMYSMERFRPYRRLFYTPFWIEGWTLHWEMLLWDLGFPRTPEERVGMLFWRLHRCVRVIFSLRFHLGEMTADECVRMLVEDVGHEPANAAGEVRRSFGGDYDALYQAAYLIGGMQVRALHSELVHSGRMTDREFHDRFLQENCMPIAMLRAVMTGMPLSRDFSGDWMFADG